MNEKIETLAKDSGVYGDMVHLYTVDCPQGYRVPKDKRLWRLNNFAELIVKECIMLCEEWIEIDKDLKKTKSWVGVDPEIGPEFCIDSIKNHFGIEE